MRDPALETFAYAGSVMSRKLCQRVIANPGNSLLYEQCNGNSIKERPFLLGPKALVFVANI